MFTRISHNPRLVVEERQRTLKKILDLDPTDAPLIYDIDYDLQTKVITGLIDTPEAYIALMHRGEIIEKVNRAVDSSFKLKLNAKYQKEMDCWLRHHEDPMLVALEKYYSREQISPDRDESSMIDTVIEMIASAVAVASETVVVVDTPTLNPRQISLLSMKMKTYGLAISLCGDIVYIMMPQK